MSDDASSRPGDSALVPSLAPGPSAQAAPAVAAASARSPTPYRPRRDLSFPQAAQPHIVRAAQKDAYYLAQLQEAVHDVARGLLGARTLHTHAASIAAASHAAYYCLATMGGAQTLGEEYVNALMTGPSGKVVTRSRRLLFILLHVLLPLLLSRLYSSVSHALARMHAVRSQAAQRAQLRAAAVRSAAPAPTRSDVLVKRLAEALPPEGLERIKSWLGWAASAHLAIFYVTGRYYSVAQRAAKVQYISTIPVRPGSRPPSYEVLGFLLGIQLSVKTLLAVLRWRSARGEKAASGQQVTHEKADDAAATASKEVVQLDQMAWSHASAPAKRCDEAASSQDEGNADEPAGPHVPLVYADPDSLPSRAALGLPENAPRKALEAARGAARTRAAELEAVSAGVLRCTLCMETRAPERGGSAVTECGHVFCWTCIVGWVREKPECPLCRQHLNASHILPIYNF